ncbi:DUF2252 domain-containing protein [Plantibacter flavus]|uniref:DUF2252 domain-containing protein n=1 Tax=Plantibacter flavus TaxID=150123 RepID=UPI003F15A0BC
MTTHLSRLQREHAPTMSHEEALAAGRAARTALPRSAHAEYLVGDRDPVAALAEQNAVRVQALVPLRLERMLQSPFAFFRGTAGLMASDLARNASTDLTVVACGDAHISNFGFYASPQRTLVFDLNDFDEAAPAPWDWDVKRLVASVVIGARQAGHTESQARRSARETARVYRETMLAFSQVDTLKRYYSLVDVDSIRAQLGKEGRRILGRATKQAQKRTSAAFLDKVTTRASDGTRRIVEDPPVLTHVSEALESNVEALFEQYRGSIPADVAHLLAQYSLTDLAFRVVGVGSVGTRCFILILTGPRQEAIVLQIKEATRSVLQQYGGADPSLVPSAGWTDAGDATPNEGRRVVVGQRILQAVSDPFLGWIRNDDADGLTTGVRHRDFYVRQFRDMKGSIDAESLDPAAYTTYVEGCAILLARGHAQSANAPAIAAYLGRSNTFDRAVTDWSFGYAAQSLTDYHRLRDAVAAGEIG